MKLAQKEAALSRGVGLICWAFDPLDARAAQRNLHDLGAESNEYLPDFPDPMSAPIYSRRCSDRIIVRWRTDCSDRVSNATDEMEQELPSGFAFVIDPDTPADSAPEPPKLDVDSEVVAVPVPADMQGLRKKHPDLHESWLCFVREALTHFFNAGYSAVDFLCTSHKLRDLGWYVLRRQ